jgi:hypothetical protein
MTAPQSPNGTRISRRALLQGAGALGLTAASSAWLRPPRALATRVPNLHGAAQHAASADHLLIDYRPSQPTGWGGVTIGGHISSVPFTFEGTSYEISLPAFGQTGSAPDPVYESEPSDPTIDFKRTLQKAWGAYYSFRYQGGFTGHSKISVQSYNVQVRAPTTLQPTAVPTHPTQTHSTGNGGGVSYGGEVFIVYEPDPGSSDPPINDDLQWIQVVSSRGRSFVDGPGRANPYYFPGAGLTSVYGKPMCSFYDRPATGFGSIGPTTGTGPTSIANLETFETFLVHDPGRKNRAGKGILDIYGGIKWGWQVQPTKVQPT